MVGCDVGCVSKRQTSESYMSEDAIVMITREIIGCERTFAVGLAVGRGVGLIVGLAEGAFVG